MGGRKNCSSLSLKIKHNANMTILVCTKDYMTVMRQTSGSATRQLLESAVGFIVYQTLHPFV